MAERTILCVDDETDILELFRDEFQECGYRVLEASNGVDAFELFKHNRIDCIISDIRMPRQDGVVLAKNIKNCNNEVPIFLVTGFSDYTSEELMNLGIQAVIFKPFDLEEVVEMVRETVESKMNP
ncbi:MAG: response regulator [Acidimicrobiaceae bacterium]|nr:response regulator [Acidimicrobiaceae bacterium]